MINNSTDESNLALAKQQKKVRNITELYNEYSNSKYNLKEIESQLLDPNNEKYNKDLFKTRTTTTSYASPTTGIPAALVEIQPYREELEEARKLLRQEEQYAFTGEFEPLVPETPGINISIPKITEIPQELVEQKAREIIVEKQRLKIKEKTITDFLNDLEDGDVLPLSLQAFKDDPELLQKVLTQGQQNFSKEYALKTEMYLEEKSVFDSDEFKNFEDYKRQALEYIEEQKQKNARQVEVVRERDYTQDVKPKTESIQTRLYSNPFANISYSQYGGTQEDQGFNYKLKQAKIAGDQLSLDKIKELGLSVYGQGFYTQPGIASWMRKNKLSYGKGKKPDTTQTTTTPGTESESLSGYTYTIKE